MFNLVLLETRMSGRLTILLFLLMCTTICSAAPTVTLSNTTRGGGSIFYVGDGFSLSISNGQPNAAVSITATQNGVSAGTASYGTTNSSGQKIITGTMSTAEIGNWVETITVGSEQATPTITFTVSALPTVTIVNTTRSGVNFFPGDGFSITVKGAPNATVTHSATKNGVSQGTSTDGSTDSSGNFTTASTIPGSSVGSWTQTWFVGGVQASPVLNFSVLIPSVSVVNTTRSGTNFYVGDGFSVTISSGPPNSTVLSTGTHNGVSTGTAAYGQTDANGQRVVTGVMSSAEVGTWLETWSVGGVQATPNISFTVSTGPTPTVTLTNTTRGGTHFYVGDSYSITISNALPNSVVNLTAIQNGGAPSSTTYGTTNSSGQRTITGTMNTPEIGNWAQSWSVAGAQATPVNFRVSALPTITLLNTTRGGNTFYVGDSFSITIVNGAPNTTITHSATKDGVSQGTSTDGTTNASGGFTTTGVMVASSVGTWAQTWYIGSVQVTPVLLFSVVASGPTISITNTTRIGNVFYVGDGFSIVISNAASNAPVTHTATKNGINQGTSNDGTTTTSGGFTSTGVITADTIGSWTQTWFVGGIQLSPVLSFSVVAAGPTITITNTTRGGTNFYVGDGFSIVISNAAPNTAVTHSATKNGVSQGTSSDGTTDSNGSFTSIGTMGSGVIGNWMQTWFVGSNQLSPVLSFSVIGQGSLTLTKEYIRVGGKVIAIENQ